MATIKDIAKEAGVSSATVSNVLNHRGNVSYEKIRLVEQAAKRMGYHLNEAAAALRSGHIKSVAVVLPYISSKAYTDLYEGITLEAQKADYSVSLHITYNDPEKEKKIVSDILSSRAEFVITIPCFIDFEKRYAPLVQNGTTIIYVERADPKKPEYIGFDLEQAAEKIAERICKDGAQSVTLLSDLFVYPNIECFSRSLSKALSQHEKNISFKRIQSVPRQYVKRAFETIGEKIPDAIVTTNEEIAHALLSAYRADGMEKMPKIYSLGSLNTIVPRDYQCFALNYRKLGQTVVQHLLSNERQTLPCILPSCGFAPQENFPRLSKPVSVYMLSENNPHFNALRLLTPRIHRELGIDLKMLPMTNAEINESISTLAKTDRYSLIRMDMVKLTRLGSMFFSPLDTLDLDLAAIRRRLIPSLWGEFTTACGVEYALPLDPSAIILFYRKDMVENPSFQRAYWERTGHSLCAPHSFAELVALSRFFDSRTNDVSKTVWGNALSNRPGEYMAHMACICQQQVIQSISEAQVEQIVQEHKELFEYSHITSRDWWSLLVDEMLNGQCAMTMTYANLAERLSRDPVSGFAGRIGFSVVPGGIPPIGGGVIGVLKAAREKNAAADLLSWLYSKEISRITTLLSGSSACLDDYQDEQLLDVYPWLSTVYTSLNCGSRRKMLNKADQSMDLHEAEIQISFLLRNTIYEMMSVQEAQDSINRILNGQTSF